jgi:hypothetical protein
MTRVERKLCIAKQARLRVQIKSIGICYAQKWMSAIKVSIRESSSRAAAEVDG